jgi:hypothetical protein
VSGQRRAHSAIEAVANVLIGYSVAVAAQLAIFPLFSIHVRFGDNLAIGAFFTVVSLARSYALRRLFNAWHESRSPPGRTAADLGCAGRNTGDRIDAGAESGPKVW